jgi:ferrochelatase
MGADETFMPMSYQSRLGRAEWLKPYTDETIARLAEEGVKRLAVATPAFAADCLETLEEIAIGGAETFRAHGGEEFTLVPCLNDSPAGMKMLEQLARRALEDWMEEQGQER